MEFVFVMSWLHGDALTKALRYTIPEVTAQKRVLRALGGLQEVHEECLVSQLHSALPAFPPGLCKLPRSGAGHHFGKQGTGWKWGL